MRGSVRKRGNPGSWEYRLELGLQPAQRCAPCTSAGRRPARWWIEGRPLACCPTCGSELAAVCERRQRTQPGFRTKRRAEEALGEVMSALRNGSFVEPRRDLSVRDYLVEQWLPSIEANLRPSTFASYQGHVESHLVPQLGTIPLQKLSAADIDAAYKTIAREGRGCGRSGLSPVTVNHIHRTLHKALGSAVERGLLLKNPAAAVRPPRATGTDRHEMKVWTAGQLRCFLAHVRDHNGVDGQVSEIARHYPLWRLIAMTGLRRGEAAGLRWCDVDLEAGSLAIRQTLVPVPHKEVQISQPKTAKGRRTIPLDSGTLAGLRLQADQQLRDCADWGEGWLASGYVFTAPDGQYLHPDRISRLFRLAVADAAAPPIRLHDLRHTAASLMIASGVPVKVVSERLGHATAAFTMDVYQHVLPGMQQEAADRLAALVD